MVHHSQIREARGFLNLGSNPLPKLSGHFSHRSYKVKLRAKGKRRSLRPHALVWEGKLGVSTGESQALTAAALAVRSLWKQCPVSALLCALHPLLLEDGGDELGDIWGPFQLHEFRSPENWLLRSSKSCMFYALRTCYINVCWKGERDGYTKPEGSGKPAENVSWQRWWQLIGLHKSPATGSCKPPGWWGQC